MLDPYNNNSSQLMCNGSVTQQNLLDNINAMQVQNECSGELQHTCVNSTSTSRDLGIFPPNFTALGNTASNVSCVNYRSNDLADDIRQKTNDGDQRSSL